MNRIFKPIFNLEPVEILTEPGTAPPSFSSRRKRSGGQFHHATY
jgi:hypothetical protein